MSCEPLVSMKSPLVVTLPTRKGTFGQIFLRAAKEGNRSRHFCRERLQAVVEGDSHRLPPEPERRASWPGAWHMPHPPFAQALKEVSEEL
jgi:hypothetical protein